MRNSQSRNGLTNSASLKMRKFETYAHVMSVEPTALDRSLAVWNAYSDSNMFEQANLLFLVVRHENSIGEDDKSVFQACTTLHTWLIGRNTSFQIGVQGR